MTRPRLGPHTATVYEIRLEGHLDEHWAAWFAGLTLVLEDDGTTSLTGVMADQAELHGRLAQVRDLGATLVSVSVRPRPSTVR